MSPVDIALLWPVSLSIQRTMSIVTVIGGTGFLGSCVVRHLNAHDVFVRAAARHFDKAGNLSHRGAQIELVTTDIRDPASIARAVSGADSVVNAVSLYVESRDATFESIHVAGARNVAATCLEHGVKKLVHLSGIGADRRSQSSYVRSRAEGETVVRQAYPSATMIRPSAMFGANDALISSLEFLSRISPVIPLFGQGTGRIQPVFVDDVASAIVAILLADGKPPGLFEFGGPDVFEFRQLVQVVLDHTRRRRIKLPVPAALWRLLAALASTLPSPPLTEGQVDLLSHDNVSDNAVPGLAYLDVIPTALETFLDARGN